MAGLILEKAAPMHQQRALEYRREFLAAGERHINGSFGLEKYTDYREWLRSVDAFLDEKTSPWGITATMYFTVRKSDGRIVGTLQLRHSLRGELVHGGVLSWEGFSEIFHTGIQIYWIDRRIYQQ